MTSTEQRAACAAYDDALEDVNELISQELRTLRAALLQATYSDYRAYQMISAQIRTLTSLRDKLRALS